MESLLKETCTGCVLSGEALSPLSSTCSSTTETLLRLPEQAVFCEQKKVTKKCQAPAAGARTAIEAGVGVRAPQPALLRSFKAEIKCLHAELYLHFNHRDVPVFARAVRCESLASSTALHPQKTTLV